MIRVCPKCGDYYADASLAFCLSDGTPLLRLEPHSESWRAGARVVEVKEQALQRQSRRLKWRRVLMSVMTMLIATMVVCVLAVNSYIYLKPKTDETTLVESPIPGAPVAAPSPRASTAPTPSPTPTCTEADKGRERESIIKQFGALWQQQLETDRPQIIAEQTPAQAENVEASFGVPKYESIFSKACTEVSVTMSYAWNINYQEINAATLVRTPKVKTVARQKRFHCVKNTGAWRCR